MPATKSVLSVNGTEEVMASMPIDLTQAYDSKYLTTVTAMSRATGADPWKWYESIGEVGYGISRGGKIAGYAKLGAYRLGKNGQPEKLVTTGKAAEVASLLSSPYGGMRSLIDRYFIFTKVPGDCYLIRTRSNPQDGSGDVTGYDFISAEEIATESTEHGWQMSDRNAPIRPNRPIKRITLPGGNGGSGSESLYTVVRPEDFLGRVWRPAGRFVEQAASPMRSLNVECELLHLLTINLKAKLTSRMALNGIFFVPSEINDIRSAGPSAQANEFHDNTVLNKLIASATWAILNHEKAEAAVPIFMTGPGNMGANIQHIVMDQALAETDMHLRVELIDRILTGLDVQKQKTRGDINSNHWSAWAHNDDELRVNVKPDLETLCWALTRLVLYREMQDAGISPTTVAKYAIWYDMADAVTNINLAEDGRQARDRILIGEEAARRTSGFNEADAPSDIDRIRAVGLDMGIPYLATYGLPEQDKFDWEKIAPTKPGPNPDSKAPKSPVGPGKGQPGSPSPKDNESDTPRRLRPA